MYGNAKLKLSDSEDCVKTDEIGGDSQVQKGKLENEVKFHIIG